MHVSAPLSPAHTQQWLLPDAPPSLVLTSSPAVAPLVRGSGLRSTAASHAPMHTPCCGSDGRKTRGWQGGGGGGEGEGATPETQRRRK